MKWELGMIQDKEIIIAQAEMDKGSIFQEDIRKAMEDGGARSDCHKGFRGSCKTFAFYSKSGSRCRELSG